MNKVIIMGRLVRDPELRRTESGTAVTSFSLAVSGGKTKDGKRETDFFDCVAWSKHAEFISKYFVKGQQMLLMGHLRTRTWEDNEGNRHRVTEIICETAEFCGSKKPENVGDAETADDDDLPF